MSRKEKEERVEREEESEERGRVRGRWELAPSSIPATRSMRLCMLAYVIAVVAVAVPYVYASSMVRRAEIPVAELGRAVNALSGWTPSQPVRVHAPAELSGYGQALMSDIESLSSPPSPLAGGIRFVLPPHLSIIEEGPAPNTPFRDMMQSVEKLERSLPPAFTSPSPSLEVFILTSTSVEGVYIGSNRSVVAMVKDEQSAKNVIGGVLAFFEGLRSIYTSPKDKVRVPLPLSLHLSTTLAVEDPTSGINGWDIDMLKTGLQAFARRVQPLSTLHIQSKVQRHFDIGVATTEKGGVHTIKEEDIPYFLPSSSLRVETSIAKAKHIQLVALVPSLSHSPLAVEMGGSNKLSSSFTVPQWGSVAFVPNVGGHDRMLGGDTLVHTLSLLLHSLRELMGMPFPQCVRSPLSALAPSPASSSSSPGSSCPNGVAFMLGRSAVAEWEMDVAARLSLHDSMISTVTSLSNVWQTLADNEEMQFTVEVKGMVVDAANHLVQARALADNRQLFDALSHAQRAQKLAEDAIFHPSFVAMLYFPPDHRLAVLLPFFFPAFVPILASLLAELKVVVGKKKRE
mmetsp:Transcript_16323/g.41389  ORF Transcript_16323/g.41389 Transcript_16323/m.41389 type:complete len:570 (-) Transcript_16323:387-2096(-)